MRKRRHEVTKQRRLLAAVLALMPAGCGADTSGEGTVEMPETGAEESSAGTDDFAYSSFKYQIEAMAAVEDGTFRYADNERDGNLYFLKQEGGTHNGEYAIEYFYNGLIWIWQP